MNIGRPRKDISDALKQRFIKLLALGYPIRKAASATGVKRTTWYALKEHEPAFGQLWDETVTKAVPFEVLLEETIAESLLKHIAAGKIEWLRYAIHNFNIAWVDPDAEHEAVKIALKRQATMGGEKAQITRLQPAGTESSQVAELA